MKNEEKKRKIEKRFSNNNNNRLSSSHPTTQMVRPISTKNSSTNFFSLIYLFISRVRRTAAERAVSLLCHHLVILPFSAFYFFSRWKTPSCMHWDVSCKVHPNIRKHRWEITFDLRSHYYIDLYVQILTSEQNKMANYVRACTEMCITKVGNYFSLFDLCIVHSFRLSLSRLLF